MIVLTEAAATEIKRVMADKNMSNQDFPNVLRIGVKGGGCSGFEYALGFDTDTNDDDLVSEQHGVTVVVKKKFDLYLDGTKLDYKSNDLKAGFVFENPNAISSCGCGESFSA